MIEQFVNFVIRPPRAEYNPDQYLWEPEFTLAGRKYKRLDLELTNERSQTLKCSHYIPAVIPENTALPCVIYCHGNSGCRADANEAAVILLPSNITLFTLDFAGSGLSDGEYVSLGWHEKQDLKCAVSFLRNNNQVSCIGLWGRSMGAVTSLLYGAEDPSIAGMVLDSSFSNLYDLMMELVEVYKIRVPKFTVKMAVQYMRRVIQKRAKFDIMDLNVIQFAPKTFIPALFGHASNDMFIQPHHTERIHQAYVGDKNLIKFEGDHNSARPQFYYDSVSIFFYNVLHPPQFPSACSNKLDKHYNLGDLKAGAGTSESLLYEIINGLRAAGSDAGSSSVATTNFRNVTKSVVELLTERVNQLSVKNDNDLDFLLDENHNLTDMDGNAAEPHLEDKATRQNEECFSYTSSNRESWGRCSSLGAASDGSSPGERPRISNQKHKVHLFGVRVVTDNMGGVFGRHETSGRSSGGSKLETKMVEAMKQRASHGTSVKSFNTIIMKFPKIDENFRKCKTIFEQFDEDSNGEIDKEELKHCFQKLEISFTEEEITDLFEACDINEDMGMKFNEFIVFLCLIYLLNEPAVSEAKIKMGLGDLEAIFETLVDAFVFLDKNKDGYVSKDEMIQAINETIGGERSSGRIGMRRFEEMDWDKNGMVTFKEFLFAFTRWVGINENEDEDE